MENLQIINYSLRVVPEKKWYGGGVGGCYDNPYIWYPPWNKIDYINMWKKQFGENKDVGAVYNYMFLYKRQKCQALHSQKTSL